MAAAIGLVSLLGLHPDWSARRDRLVARSLVAIALLDSSFLHDVVTAITAPFDVSVKAHGEIVCFRNRDRVVSVDLRRNGG